jgi:hypothetical protein
MRDCERITRGEGFAAGLAAALSGAGLDRAEAAAAAPGPFAAVPAGWVPAGVPARRNHLADLEGIVFVECRDERLPSGPAGRLAVAELARLLAAVRLGLLRRLLDLAVEHLSGRVSGDEPLVRKQLVVGTIADVMAGVELIRAAADCQLAPEALGDLHRQLDELGWEVTKLFGAAGYITDHEARALYVSALTASTWVDREQVAP